MNLIGTFHHVGLACHDIEAEAANLTAVGYVPEAPPIADPIQKVRVQFFNGGGPRIELIEPTAAESPVTGILKRGTKFYHIGYEVENLENAIKILDERSFRPIGPAAPAIAFGMQRIIFMMAKTGILIELIEKPAV